VQYKHFLSFTFHAPHILPFGITLNLFIFADYKKNTILNMPLSTTKKKEIFTKYGGAETNTGSAEAQIAIFTERINELSDHMKSQAKDYSTERSLIRLVGKRRSLLDFLMKNDIERYRKIINDLGIRK
jgi:small subunit ribosomal protein S15